MKLDTVLLASALTIFASVTLAEPVVDGVVCKPGWIGWHLDVDEPDQWVYACCRDTSGTPADDELSAVLSRTDHLQCIAHRDKNGVDYKGGYIFYDVDWKAGCTGNATQCEHHAMACCGENYD